MRDAEVRRNAGRRYSTLLIGLAGAIGAASIWRVSAGPSIARTVPSAPSGLRDACRAVAMAYPPPSPRVEIRKAKRTLTIFSGATRLTEYRVGLGGSAVGPKTRQGDRRTPVGEFYVCTRLARSQFHRFLGLSYPLPEDAALARREGRVSRSDEERIGAAHRGKRRPPWDTPLGGAIGIHGGGGSTDWTLGCIAVENAEIEDLFESLPHGTSVRIIE